MQTLGLQWRQTLFLGVRAHEAEAKPQLLSKVM